MGSTTIQHNLPTWLFAFLKVWGRFPLKENQWEQGGWLENISSTGVIWSLLLTALCILCSQPTYLILSSVFSSPDRQLDLRTEIAMSVMVIHHVVSYTLFSAWYFALPGLLKCSQKLASYNEKYWGYIGEG